MRSDIRRVSPVLRTSGDGMGVAVGAGDEGVAGRVTPEGWLEGTGREPGEGAGGGVEGEVWLPTLRFSYSSV